MGGLFESPMEYTDALVVLGTRSSSFKNIFGRRLDGFDAEES